MTRNASFLRFNLAWNIWELVCYQPIPVPKFSGLDSLDIIRRQSPLRFAGRRLPVQNDDMP